MNSIDCNKQAGKKRYGILGGTFDPIHNGHLFIAQIVLEALQLNKILFIPNRISPFKEKESVTEAYHRGVMTEIATADNLYFDVSSVEIQRSGYSYTIDTVRQLISENPVDTALYFIIGTDVFMEIEGWKDYRELLKLINLVIVTRGNFDNRKLDEKIEYFTNEYKGDIIKLAIPTLEISSTDIRDRVRKGKNIKYMVPPGVEAYIHKHDLYKE
ncbi:nicotinate-nucleotide adenylyltransferase [Alkaliphilus crotonatoxidans]